MVSPIRIAGIETGTGIGWSEWLDVLELHKRDTHAELADFTLEYIETHGKSASPEWWAQGVAVAYEQHIGRRAPGQSTDGSYNVTISKTIPGDMDEALVWWNEKVAGIERFDGVRRNDYSETHTDAWRYWRCTLDDGSKVSVNIHTKPNGTTSIVAVNHDKLPDAQSVERKRAYWKDIMNS